ncbi:MAG: hypothetical protein L0177_03395 [Chloroflexi bacterium]|nr:hypothetical protein [Chloroflexota bacterium]
MGVAGDIDQQVAQKVVLSVEAAYSFGPRNGLILEGLGGTNQGVIGALAAAGLRASGNDGRFISLRGVRDIEGVVSAGDIKEKTGIASVQTARAVELPDTALVDSQGWLRPRLIDGRPVLQVESHPEMDGGWISVDRRRQNANRNRA